MRIADYRDIEILPDSAIYCDPPYKNTEKYIGEHFDHEAFYDWAERQESPVFISEYDMDEDRFFVVATKERTCSYSSTNNSLKRVEKIYMPKRWYDRFRPQCQTSLFGDI